MTIRSLFLGAILSTSWLSAAPLTETQKDFYEEQGYLLLENFVSAEECDALASHIDSMCDGFDYDTVASIFSTENNEHTRNLYFLESGDKIRFFYEAKAIEEDGSLNRDPKLAINKIGHAMHDLDPVFAKFSYGERFQQLSDDLGIEDARVIQSMIIFKQPEIGGAVLPHQDASFVHSEPDSVVGLWLALEDATLENGCLWVMPGAHREPLRIKMNRTEDDTLVFEEMSDEPWDTSMMVPLEVKKGSLIVIHSHIPHMSLPNESDHSRLAYTLHLFDAAKSEYPSTNWLQRSEELPFRGF